ncbi:hypothetical protein DAI22_03g003600 [Oryza sativa Japonica Group]|nr:hypothetical protein DAI22_03g003600 [Oryza sativa Japonica Group]
MQVASSVVIHRHRWRRLDRCPQPYCAQPIGKAEGDDQSIGKKRCWRHHSTRLQHRQQRAPSKAPTEYHGRSSNEYIYQDLPGRNTSFSSNYSISMCTSAHVSI